MEKKSIDMAIDKRDENSNFDEATAQLAVKIMDMLHYDDDDEVDGFYEDLKDVIREHVIDWRQGRLDDVDQT